MRLAVALIAALIASPAISDVSTDRIPDLDSRDVHYFMAVTPDGDKSGEFQIIIGCLGGDTLVAQFGPEDIDTAELTYSLDGGAEEWAVPLTIKYDPEREFLHNLAVAETMTASINDGPIQTYSLPGVYDAVASITRNCPR